MPRNGPEYAAELAQADQHYTHLQEHLAGAVAQARDLLATHDPVHVWVHLGIQIEAEVHPETQDQQFAVELLVAAVIQLAQQPAETTREGS